jgi:hypothetical protein
MTATLWGFSAIRRQEGIQIVLNVKSPEKLYDPIQLRLIKNGTAPMIAADIASPPTSRSSTPSSY